MTIREDESNQRFRGGALSGLLLVCLTLQVTFCQRARAVTITFERSPGLDGKLGTGDDVALSELTHISNQFESVGVVFSLVQGGTPFIATAGDPRVAFGGPGHWDDDQPTASGSNTLTDGTTEGGTAAFEADIAADFVRPVSSVSLVLIDYVGDCPLDTTGITASLNAYDAQNRLVASDSYTVTGEEHDGMLLPLQVTAPGIMRVELSGTTEDCGTAIDDFAFTLEAVPPVAVFEYSPSNPVVNEEVDFDASASEDPDGGALTYEWDFGDGATGSGTQETHTYDQKGDYTVTLKVVDSDGLDATVSKTITVEGLPPVASFTYSPAVPLPNDEVVFNASDSEDPDGGALTYDWDFGDGTTGAGMQMTHVYQQSGRYTARLTVADNDGLEDSFAQEIVGGELIAAFTHSPEEPLFGAIVTFDASGSFPQTEIQSYAWHWGDGESSGIRDSSRASHVYASGGTYQVTLTVRSFSGIMRSTSAKVNVRSITDLKIGDILLCRSEGSWVPAKEWTHAAIYDGAGGVVEATREEGIVNVKPLSDWLAEREWVRVVRLKEDDPKITARAVEFARTQAEFSMPYDTPGIFAQGFGRQDKGITAEGWYCSELVWAAYMYASGGEIDLDMNSYGNAVAPDEINEHSGDSGQLKLVAERKNGEKPPIRVPLAGVLKCPVDLVIYDPDGLILSKQSSQITDTFYEEIDFDGDGELADFFVVAGAKSGDYSIWVIPELWAARGDTYSLEVAVNGDLRVLEEEKLVSEIPENPYIVTVAEHDPPLAHWTFDEGAGNIAWDASGNGHDATLRGQPRWVVGIVGGALDFDGSNAYVDCGSHPAFDMTAEFTIAAWVNLAAVTRGQHTVIGKGGEAWSISTVPDTRRLQFGYTTGAGWQSTSSDAQLSPNEWYHVCGTYGRSTGARIYVDGALSGSSSYHGSITHNRYPVFIGQLSGRFWKGLIDEVMIYDKVLSADEVFQLAREGLTKKQPPRRSP